MAHEYESTLRAEFEADEGSFLLRLRCDLEWDPVAFSRLVGAMRECCLATQAADRLIRWQAEGFWYLSTFVPSWIAHPNFPRVHPPDYYEQALEQLDTLASWYFMGESPQEETPGAD